VLLYDQPPLLLRARIIEPPYEPYPVSVIVSHFQSLAGIDGVNGFRVRTRRRAQAELLAALVQGRQLASPTERLIALGTFNAFEFSDGYVDVLGTVAGTPAPATQVVQGSADLVNPNLVTLTSQSPVVNRYSVVHEGNAQALDHLLTTANLAGRLEYARLAADFPLVLRNDPARPELATSHDGLVGFFALPAIDTSPPVLNLPPDMVVEATGWLTSVSFEVTATDTVEGAVAVSCAPPSGSAFPLGTTEVTCTASDSRHNTASGTFRVRVVDTTPPQIESLVATPPVLWPPNHEMRAVVVSVTARDLDQALSCRVTSVTSNEEVAPSGRRSPPGDWAIADPLQVWLRAERSPAGRGRIYTIVVTCTDGSGNSSWRAATVTVPVNLGTATLRDWRPGPQAQRAGKPRRSRRPAARAARPHAP
jgi:hypothetical protein